MRAIGMAERIMDMVRERVQSRRAFGKMLHEHGATLETIATMRIDLEQSRHLVRHAAKLIDDRGAKAAMKEIAIVKVRVDPCNHLDNVERLLCRKCCVA